jgi:glutathione synthase/RimK-type ligase-like ATP-grasp enzyme
MIVIHRTETTPLSLSRRTVLDNDTPEPTCPQSMPPAFQYDVVILTDSRYTSDIAVDAYTGNILLEEGLVRAALESHGLRAQRVAWSDETFDWSRTRSVLFRSTWDYFDRFGEFVDWLDRTSRVTRPFNSPDLVRWNWDKHYLLDLERMGVRIPPTVFLDGECSQSLPELVRKTGWPQVILKPTVSGAARHTYLLNHENAAAHHNLWKSLQAQESMLLQCFQDRVLSEGELSLVVIGGRYTHAVRKVAQPGDFRVQDDHGGTVYPHTASDLEIAFAEQCVAACPTPPIYARVDAVRNDTGQLVLMELELIEPELFFRFHPPAAGDLADRIAIILRGAN